MTEYTLRDAIREKSPKWLQGPIAQRLLYTLALMFDVLLDSVVKGTRLRFPGQHGYESLPLLARDTGAIQGLNETEAAFAERMWTWRQDRRTKSSPFTLMRRLRGFLIGGHPSVWFECIYNNGRTLTLANDGTPSVSDNALWDWDGGTGWSRFVVVIHDTEWTDEGTWGDAGNWGDGGTLGSDMTTAESEGLRRIVADETPPHAKCMTVIVVLDELGWNANQPDGTWDYWDNRYPGCLYMSGR